MYETPRGRASDAITSGEPVRAIKFSLLVVFYILSYNLICNKRWIGLFIFVMLASTVVNFSIVLYQVVGLGINRPRGGSTGPI